MSKTLLIRFPIMLSVYMSLNLSRTYQEQPNTRPPSCATPLQLSKNKECIIGKNKIPSYGHLRHLAKPFFLLLASVYSTSSSQNGCTIGQLRNYKIIKVKKLRMVTESIFSLLENACYVKTRLVRTSKDGCNGYFR